MSDIVERLREHVLQPESLVDEMNLMSEAADKIENLRTWETEARTCHRLLFEKDAKIERLRKALHQLQGCDIDNAAQDIIIHALGNNQ